MKKRDFEVLLDSVREAGAIRRGEREPSRELDFGPEEIRTIRSRLRLTQPEFASMIGVSVGTLRNWEQGRRRPDGPAMALLVVAAHAPQVVADALHPRRLSRTLRKLQ